MPQFIQYGGLILLSLSWVYRVPFIAASETGWLPLTLGGLIALIAGSDRQLSRVAPDAVVQGRGILWLLAVGLLVGLTMPPGAPHGIFLLLAGSVACLAAPRAGIWRHGAWTCVLAGVILIAQRMLTPILELVSVHAHSLPGLAWILYPILRLVDPSVTLGGDRLYLVSRTELYPTALSFERLAGAPLLLVLAALWLWAFFNGTFSRIWLRSVLIVFAYGLVRFIFVALAVARFGADWLYWRPDALVLTIAPLAFLLGRPGPMVPQAAKLADSARPRMAWFRLAATGLGAAFLIAAGLTFHDPGARKAGRVLFDERHSNWEWTTEAYDRNWYGQKSGYNYYSLKEYVRRHFAVEVGDSEFSPDYLAQYDVVIIKTPTMSFDVKELDALVAFVRHGGGLFLIGDHTNVFGTSTYLNAVAERFGLRFDYNATYDLMTGALSYYQPPTYLGHPCLAGMPGILFATSCTIACRPWDEHMIIGYGVRAVAHDYSQRNYFPVIGSQKDYDSGFVLQMAGARVGQGRVAGFTDSTVFSNFFMFMPGKPDLFLGTVEWLNRRNRWGFLAPLLVAFGCTLMMDGVRRSRMTRGTAGPLVVLFVALGITLAFRATDVLKRLTYKSPAPRESFERVAFDLELSGVHLPARRLMARGDTPSFDTFFVWTQRLNLVPSAHARLEDALTAGGAAVIANPRRNIEPREVDQIADYVRHGGTLLLMFDAGTSDRAVSGLLGMFKMQVVSAAVDSTPAADLPGKEFDVSASEPNASVQKADADTATILNLRGQRICRAVGARRIRGGTPVLTLDDGNGVLAYSRFGDGRFFAFGDFRLFSNAVMGPTSVTPTPAQREIYELEFQLLEIMIRDREPANILPYTARTNEATVTTAM